LKASLIDIFTENTIDNLNFYMTKQRFCSVSKVLVESGFAIKS